MKKLKMLIVIIIIFFSFFLIKSFKKKSYVVNYKVDKYSVYEKYNKKDKAYYIEIKKGKDKYFFILNNKRYKKKKLVSNIKIYTDENKKCMTIKFNKNDFTPSCTKDGEYISHFLIGDKLKEKLGKKYFKKTTSKSKTSYHNINVENLFDNEIFIWNYHGFYKLSTYKNEEISLFKNDTYDAQMIGSINNYIIVPNYNESYEYSKLKVLDINDLKVSDLKLKDNISSDSYVLGTNDKSIYYYDKKYEREYEIVPHKLKYRTVNPVIYVNGKKETKTKLGLKNSETKFIYDTIYNYEIINDSLYRTNKYNKEKEKISDKNVKYIVKENNDEVYFISEDTLYVNKQNYGDIKILDYFELNFNYKYIIHIF